MPTASPTAPISSGSSAPPTIIITRRDEPWEVCSPRSSIARVKMLDHMIELNRPVPRATQRATLPVAHAAISSSRHSVPENSASTAEGSPRATANAPRQTAIISANGQSSTIGRKLTSSRPSSNRNAVTKYTSPSSTAAVATISSGFRPGFSVWAMAIAPQRRPIIAPPQ